MRLSFATIAAVVGAEPYGICWTRNQAEHGHDFRDVARSAMSVQRAAYPVRVPLCLFTNFAERAVDRLMRDEFGYDDGTSPLDDARWPLFRYVLPDGYDGFAPRTAAEAALLNPDRKKDEHERIYAARSRTRSRVGKILNLARSPFELTLFTDDDTYFCGGSADIVSTLAFFYRERHRYTVRARVFLGHHSPLEANYGRGRECVWSRVQSSPPANFSAALEAECFDAALQGACLGESGLQSGALAVASGAALDALVRAWVDSYLDQHVAYFGLDDSKTWYGTRRLAASEEGSDQSAFIRLARGHCGRGDAWTAGHLPATFNVRNVDRILARANETTGECPRSPRSRAGAFGPILHLHHKRYVHEVEDLDGLCRVVNRPVAAGGGAWRGADDGGLGCFGGDAASFVETPEAAAARTPSALTPKQLTQRRHKAEKRARAPG